MLARQPLAVLIEDIHWADERMLRMIEALATRSQAHPDRRDVAAGVPRDATRFRHRADMSVVSLRPLTDAQSQRLIAELIGQRGAAAVDMVEEIQRKADGNPFFLEELLQRLVDEGALVEVDGQWQATNVAADVRAARHDPWPARRAHRCAHDRTRSALCRKPQSSAESSGLVRFVAAPTKTLLSSYVASSGADSSPARPTSTIEDEPEYIFRHVLIRDVAYASVPKKRRARAHAETGRWIETLAGDRADEFAELIAFHYGAAVSGDDVDLAWEDEPQAARKSGSWLRDAQPGGQRGAPALRAGQGNRAS